ncbi:MAG: type I DNA topoisomerase [Phycisphaerales bacterium]
MAKTTKKKTSPTSTKKKTTPKKAGSAAGKRSSSGSAPSATGKQLVIVESPAKAKTINKYLGPGYVVRASIGHVRDLPSKNPKGVKQPVPGVDLESNFEPTYEILPGKKKTVTELKRAAKQADDVWFATDLDREGEAIAWHLAQELGIEASQAKRVIFNAITRAEIERAFTNPLPIDEFKVNAQQARRILDRIVGYQVSPLLWKKVARGLSAGRVQSVAVRLVVERERAIRAFIPDESWKVTARLAINPDDQARLMKHWQTFIVTKDERGNTPTIKSQNAWLSEHNGLLAELIEVNGEKFSLTTTADEAADLSSEVERIAIAVGLRNISINNTENPEGKGPARTLRTVSAEVDPAARYQVESIETRKTTSRPNAPFITSTLQMAASSLLSFGAQRTMRTAQSLYEGVDIKGEGQVGLITYMRTDSTHISPEAIQSARAYISKTFGDRYLPAKPHVYGSRNKAAQEAHEAIRPTDASRHPDKIEQYLKPEQAKLYRLIWKRFVASQMTPAEWDSTTVRLARSDKNTGVVLKASGRVLTFDGFYRVAGVPTASDEQMLPELREEQQLAPFDIDPQQSFSNPPPRFTEASLVKELESEGIGRPSTYAAIIQVIQDRDYVEQIDRRFYSTDLGEVVTDKLIECFPHIMDVGYTRDLESKLDSIEEAHTDWVDMLHHFYDGFAEDLEHAMENVTHAKAEIQPAPYACPECGRRTCYRFGKNGRFLSCSGYPDCKYATPIDREGRPRMPERVNVACPIDDSEMVLRTGRFGQFLASSNYPEVEYIINVDRKGNLNYPSPPPYATELKCDKCGSPLNLRDGKRGPWLGCSAFPKCRGRMGWTKLDEAEQKKLEVALANHLKANPVPVIRDLDGNVIPDGTPIASLMMEGGAAELATHPEAEQDSLEAA